MIRSTFYLMLFMALLSSCDNDSDKVKQYYSNGKVKLEYSLNKGRIDGMYLEYYDNGNIKLTHLYEKGKIIDTSKYYWNDKNKIIQRQSIWLNDSVSKDVIFDSKGEIEGVGKVVNKEKLIRIGKWKLKDSQNINDSIVEYLRIRDGSHVNQIWTISPKGDTIISKSNYYKIFVDDTISLGKPSRIRIVLVEPFYSYDSDIEAVIPANNMEMKKDFSNLFKINKDVFKSLKNDGIPHPEIPEEIPTNHIIEFGLIYEEKGLKEIKGCLTEYVQPHTDSIQRIERRLYFNESLYVQ